MQRGSDVADLRANTMDFSRFPAELHHYILCFAEPEDIIALRKTCKYFFALTQEPHLWTVVHNRMRHSHPLSCSRSEFAALTVSQSERLLVRASRTQKRFTTTRGDIQHRITPNGQTHTLNSLVALSFLSERYLLSVDDTTVVCVWDIWELSSSAEAPSFPRARLTLVEWHFVTYNMSSDHSTLYIILSKGARTHIFSLSLPLNASDTDKAKLCFRDVAYFDSHFNRVYSIDMDSCLVLLELSYGVIEVVDWRTDSRSRVAIRQDTPRLMPPWNDILATLICGPYILCLRCYCIDAYPIPLQTLKPELAAERPLPVLYHDFVGMMFSGDVSLSRVLRGRSPSDDTYTIRALANTYRGGMHHLLFHLQITPKPSLSVRVLGSDKDLTSPRFSAWNLGASGLRGVRVPRTNYGADQRIVTFTTHPSQYSFDPNDVPPERPPSFDEQVVSVVSSKECHGKVARCAVSEFTGRIALGSRTGTITVL